MATAAIIEIQRDVRRMELLERARRRRRALRVRYTPLRTTRRVSWRRADA